MSVKERLIAYLDYKCISKSEFGRAIGVSTSYIHSIRKSIQPDKIQGIAQNYADLNINWLLTGEGEMLLEDDNANLVEPEISFHKTTNTDIMTQNEMFARLIEALERRDELAKQQQSDYHDQVARLTEAIERRDHLAMKQQEEYAKQGDRIDKLISMVQTGLNEGVNEPLKKRDAV